MSYSPLLAGDNGRSTKDEWQNTTRWWMRCLEPTVKISAKQRFWVWQNTVLTCWVTFGVSFLVGYLMLSYKPTPTLEDMLMNFIATALLTPILNWSIGTTLMSGEVLLGRVAVVDSRELPWWPKEVNPHSVPFKGWRWWFTTSDLVLRPSYYPPTKTWCEFFQQYSRRLGCHVVRSAPWIVLSQFTVPVFYVFSKLVYGNVMLDDYPQPQLLTSIQAVIIALVTTPIWARMVLANMGSKLVNDESYLDFIHDLEVHDADIDVHNEVVSAVHSA
mmetsp:Transcript_611/g.1009  ORF Transcript_611/g.1009 Transcript_611/m.1009 type:complete len:273 (-) Transcript_611:120-938(-)